MRKLFIVVLAISLMGCVSTLKGYFNDWDDSNQYEAARDIDMQLCDPDILARLQKTRTKAWYDATVKDCQSRKETNIPLIN